LQKLLVALASGARSVNALPKAPSQTKDDDNSESDDERDDEFGYQMAFSEFKKLCMDSRLDLASLLNQSLQSTASVNNKVEGYEFDDPILWETAAEACDVLLERVERYIQNEKEGRMGQDGAEIGEAVGVLNSRRKSGFDQIVGSLVEMEKPQITFNFAGTVQNSRTDAFLPQMHPQKPFSINSSFKFEPVAGHGLESRKYGGASDEYLKTMPDEIVAPSEHYPHPYKEEINSLKYRTWQLQSQAADNGEHGTSGTLNNPAMATTKGVWIDNEDDLMCLVDRINAGGVEMREISIDLEAHSFRSFSGFVCLMQLSLRRPAVKEGTMAEVAINGGNIDIAYDFVIDTFALRNVMNEHFAPIMANPNIVKVMHGADSDVGWLQRDFGIYIVNLFDTGRASRALPHFSRAGLAYLLSKYANVEADKKHQLSDWRQRPLPSDMLAYAVSDTMYLLDIYDKLRVELFKHDKKSNDISIEAVLDASKKVCLIRYDKEPFKPNAYRNLIMPGRGNKKGLSLSEEKDKLLKRLFDWRDNTAREEDESVQHVCGNRGLVRIASTCPQTILSLKSCMNPLPPLIFKYANDILRLVRIAIGKKVGQQVLAAGSDNKDKSSALEYVRLQSHFAGNEEDDTSSSDVEMSELSAQSINLNYSSTQSMTHSLDMRTTKHMMSKGVNGLGAAKAAMNEGEEGSSVKMGTVAKQSINAEKAATKVRKTLTSGNQNLLRLAKSTQFVGEDDKLADEEMTTETTDHEEDGCEVDELPRSLKEIYRMSNQNRRKVSRQNEDSSPSKRPKTQNIYKGDGTFAEEQESKAEESGQHTNGSKEIEEVLIASFDYSKVGEIGASGTKTGSNPFFEGAAVRGGALNSTAKSKLEKKKKRARK